MKVPKAPDGLRTAGRELWCAVQSVYELEAHESRLLLEMCRSADLLDTLAAVVESEGPMLDGRAHPAAVESRQQKIAFARLSAALRLPAGDADSGDQQAGARRPQRRVGMRAPYSLRRGGAA
ncbi:MAG TPA: hypothetical protein VFQ48_10400 [Pseudonocardiaceae bacterium]|nr:hypothetical protein [Pseudonocardiaceae bacterium]